MFSNAYVQRKIRCTKISILGLSECPLVAILHSVLNILSFYARESKHDKVVTYRHVVTVANTCPFWDVAN